jgi:hypothetical protein
MDDASLKRMAARLAGGAAPAMDPLSELVVLVDGCRKAINAVSSGVADGSLTEDSFVRMWGSLNERAASACEVMRSCKNEIEAILPTPGTRTTSTASGGSLDLPE